MATTYWQTASSFGATDNPANVPVGASIITLATYNGLLATWTAGQVPPAYVPLGISYETSLALADWTHTLAGADNVFEKIGELPDVVAVEAGFYVVEAIARGNVGLQAGAAVSTAAITAQVAVNNGLIAGTQFRLASVSKTAVASPVINNESTGTLKFGIQLAAGDALSLWASRVSTAPQQTTVSSNAQGRSRIIAQRIR